MTMPDHDPRLAEHLRTLVDDAPIPLAPTHAVLRRGRRARRRRVLTAAASGVALTVAAASFAVVTVTGARPPERPSERPGAAAADDPQLPRMRLVGAARATGDTSFRQAIAITVEGYDALGAADRAYVGSLHGLTLVGAFDPKSVTGYVKTPTGEQRIVGGDLYVGDGGPAWKRIPGKQTGLSVVGVVDGTVDPTADPTRFLEVLNRLGTVQQTAPDAYRFSGTITGGEGADYPISGEVTVVGGRIARLSYRVPPWRPAPGRAPVVLLVTVELSGYGEPVSVERPTIVVD